MTIQAKRAMTTNAAETLPEDDSHELETVVPESGPVTIKEPKRFKTPRLSFELYCAWVFGKMSNEEIAETVGFD